MFVLYLIVMFIVFQNGFFIVVNIKVYTNIEEVVSLGELSNKILYISRTPQAEMLKIQVESLPSKIQGCFRILHASKLRSNACIIPPQKILKSFAIITRFLKRFFKLWLDYQKRILIFFTFQRQKSYVYRTIVLSTVVNVLWCDFRR